MLDNGLGVGDVFRYKELDSGLVEGALSEGNHVFRYVDGSVRRYCLDYDGRRWYQSLENGCGVVVEENDGFGYRFGDPVRCEISFGELDDDDVVWFVPYFDIRKRMLDKPNEWVGVLFGEDCVYNVGFCYDAMTECVVDYELDLPTDIELDDVNVFSKSDIPYVIPIERYESKLDGRDIFYF